jgi:hypothetical protein
MRDILTKVNVEGEEETRFVIIIPVGNLICPFNTKNVEFEEDGEGFGLE